MEAFTNGPKLGAATSVDPNAAPVGDGMGAPVDPSLIAGLDVLKDVPLRLTVELGRTRLLIRDVLALRSGAVVELDRPAGAPADVLVNGVLIARGEVVVVEDRFGVRIAEVLNQAQAG